MKRVSYKIEIELWRWKYQVNLQRSLCDSCIANPSSGATQILSAWPPTEENPNIANPLQSSTLYRPC